MPLRRFLPYDVVGAGAWATALLVLGYVFWQSFDQVLHYAERGTLALGTTIVVLVAVIWLVRRVRTDEGRAAAMAWIGRQLERPALRPLGAVLRPLWRRTRRPRRFVWNRVTPGGLGLELTTLLAIAAVGSFVVVGDAITLQDDAYVIGDPEALDVADDVRTPWLTTMAKALTTLGSSAVVGPAVALTAAVLLWRRRAREAAVLAAGALLTWGAVNVAKPMVDRPRPSGGLVATAGDSFPSGHAAYAVTWVAIAVVLTRTMSGSRRTLVIGGAIVLAVAVGLTRVYLRAHYLSDVAAGFGLGATLYALCAMAALVVAHLRHNAVRA
jgi:undecaprenyl-diphosphatase